jgi:hypothetical protein
MARSYPPRSPATPGERKLVRMALEQPASGDDPTVMDDWEEQA